MILLYISLSNNTNPDDNEQIKQYNDILDNNNNDDINKQVKNNNNTLKANLKRQQPQKPKAEIDIGGVIATNWGFGKNAYKDEDYVFRTLQINIPDEETGNSLPGFTVAQYIIQPKKRSKWLKYNRDALYYVEYGDSWFLVGKAGSAIETGYYLCVPQDTEHIILNSNAVNVLRVNLIFPGAIVVK